MVMAQCLWTLSFVDLIKLISPFLEFTVVTTRNATVVFQVKSISLIMIFSDVIKHIHNAEQMQHVALNQDNVIGHGGNKWDRDNHKV